MSIIHFDFCVHHQLYSKYPTQLPALLGASSTPGANSQKPLSGHSINHQPVGGPPLRTSTTSLRSHFPLNRTHKHTMGKCYVFTDQCSQGQMMIREIKNILYVHLSPYKYTIYCIGHNAAVKWVKFAPGGSFSLRHQPNFVRRIDIITKIYGDALSQM